MKKIAIIGSGISGLTSAYFLSKEHDVTVFEKNDYIGGHTATIDVELDGKDYAVDTGFIVFNNRTYPVFQKLMAEIGMGKQETEMSFSVHHTRTGIEYNGHTFFSMFAQKRNWLNPKFWAFLYSIVRFNKLAKAAFERDVYGEQETLGDFLADNGFDDFFQQHYILPMGAAIWSSSLADMRGFPLAFFIRFFYHHGLLDITNRPQWYVIPGGSKSYITPLTKSFSNNIKLNSELAKVTRTEQGATLHFENGESQAFDEVIFACHSDQALALLDDASKLEKEILSAIPYTENSVILHTDAKMLPKRRAAWASWNYRLSDDENQLAAVTYNMNILQGIESNHTFCVSLNSDHLIDDSKILRKFIYHHPLFNKQSFAAQQRRSEICGHNHTHFCGAYWYNGFHEDGARSGLDIAKRFGIDFEN